MRIYVSAILACISIVLVLAAGCTAGENRTTSDLNTSGIQPLMRGDGGGHAVMTTAAVHKAEPAPPQSTVTTVTTTKTPVNYGAPVVQTTTMPVAFLTQVVTAVGANPVTVLGCTPGNTPCGSMCANLTTDSKNCGTCGLVCPATLPVCSLGKCSVK